MVRFTFDGEAIEARAGETIAAALLAAGRDWLRLTPVSQSRRGPFCLMGTCYDCLVRIDGETVQACMTPVSDGLVVERQPAAATFEGEQE